MSFEEIKNDGELFAKFTEVLNGGIEMLYKFRDTTDNLWVIKAAMTTLLNMCDTMIIEKGITKEEVKEFENEMSTFLADLYQEFIRNRNKKNE